MDSFIKVMYFLVVVGYTQSQEIIEPPTDITNHLGETAVLNCVVSGDISNNGVTWREFINAPTGRVIYRSDQGVIGPEEKYEVNTTVQGHHDLHIKNVVLEDGGLYSCSLDTTIEPYQADVVILGEPMQVRPDIIEGQTSLIRCETRYGGPSGDDIKEEHKAQMSLTIEYPSGEEVLDGEVTELIGSPGPEGEYIPWSLKMEVNRTFTAADNGYNLTCNVYTTLPEYSNINKEPLDVKFDVRDMELAPINIYYFVGEVINCTARGNPEPTFKWEPIQSPGSRPVSTPQLEITSNMVGDNVWVCQATNTVDGIHDIDQEISFEVRIPDTGSATKFSGTSLVVLCSVILSLYFRNDIIKII